ncbi:MAG: hypothetical protein M0Z65_14470 [Firmicutes bacterium]|uniref:Uncharacterized protein n=1 Tax=Melghirimyces thermohalophilus TaxID=1236220 RepID=A0A1G6PWP3_9BACL|nr:hypothetical protein [Melghirimyces thermohalophilus]MDA8354353.1 hypothetical protein [Bacillota bacterium]SDC83807.1 hypothetical protein SAMN04488112_11849 [Melghirimyces thermohalophilus]
MNKKAAVFACRFTGFIGLLVSLLFWYMYGLSGLVLGCIGSMVWFGLGWYVQHSANT